LTDAVVNPLPLDDRSNAMTMALGNAVDSVGTPRPPMAKPFALDKKNMIMALRNVVGLVRTPHPPMGGGGAVSVPDGTSCR
jgi:hypothetical protein